MIEAENLGIQYLFDRQQRTVSPMMRRFRRSAGETWFAGRMPSRRMIAQRSFGRATGFLV